MRQPPRSHDRRKLAIVTDENEAAGTQTVTLRIARQEERHD